MKYLISFLTHTFLEDRCSKFITQSSSEHKGLIELIGAHDTPDGATLKMAPRSQFPPGKAVVGESQDHTCHCIQFCEGGQGLLFAPFQRGHTEAQGRQRWNPRLGAEQDSRPLSKLIWGLLQQDLPLSFTACYPCLRTCPLPPLPLNQDFLGTFLFTLWTTLRRRLSL